MIYSEMSYFGGANFQYIADWLDVNRVERRRIESVRAAGVRGR